MSDEHFSHLPRSRSRSPDNAPSVIKFPRRNSRHFGLQRRLRVPGRRGGAFFASAFHSFLFFFLLLLLFHILPALEMKTTREQTIATVEAAEMWLHFCATRLCACVSMAVRDLGICRRVRAEMGKEREKKKQCLRKLDGISENSPAYIEATWTRI